MKTFVVATCCAFVLCVSSSASAQAADSARVAAARAAHLDSLKAPIAPRKAFFYSFLLPGYSQSVLGRHKAATGFLLVEAISIGMIRESAADKHEAQRIVNDTIIVSYVDAQGQPARIVAPPQFNQGYVSTRGAHVEDWIALLVANHLFAGADAFVAANLWDVPVRLGLRRIGEETVLTASMKW